MAAFPLALPCALNLHRLPATFRQSPADFVVDEILGFELTGDGEHLWLHVEKTGINTHDVVKALARLIGARERDIGYAGMKDRHAVASQWFSVRGGKPVDTDTRAQGFRVLEQVRNARKLRRGSHRGNRFRITLRDMTVADATLAQWQDTIRRRGVPNYFGQQRFGQDGSNLDSARQYFSGELVQVSHFQRGIYLSAARAYLFNQVLAARVQAGNWETVMAGDVMALAGTGSVFAAEQGDERLPARLATGDIHPTGPMWGQGDLKCRDDVRTLEEACANEFSGFATGLAQAGLEQERRALRVMPGDMQLSPADTGTVVVEFSLPRGAFATSVLREMVEAPGL